MHQTLLNLCRSLLAVLSFIPLLTAPGLLLLLLGRALPSMASRAQRLLWSIVLSLPCSLILTAVVGRSAALRFVTHPPLPLLLLATSVLVLLTFHTAPLKAPLARPSATTSAILGALALLLLYILFATAPIQIGPHLFEPVAAADWSVRLPLVAASIRHA